MVTELRVLKDVKSSLLKTCLPLGKVLKHKPQSITTMGWLRLSSRPELCDKPLTTETTLLLCYTGKKTEFRL